MNKQTSCKEKTPYSPPWYILRNQFFHTIGKSPFIKVKELIELEGNYLLHFKVSNFKIANALRKVIYESYSFGNVQVITIVIGPDGKVIPFVPQKYYTPMEVACNLRLTMCKNPLYTGILLDFPTPDLSFVVCILKRNVVQFYADDLSDFCLNYLEVASKVIGSLLKTFYPGKNESTIRVFYTTKDKRCLQGTGYYYC